MNGQWQPGGPACPCLHFDGTEPELERLGLGAAALRWQQRLGYAVLALGAGSKRPHKLFSAPNHPGTAGVHWATRNPAMAEYVWSRDRLAGIGIATGSINQLLVIDLDVHGNDDGTTTFYSFLSQNRLEIPPGAPMVSTPSGGLHVWLRLPAGIEVPSRTGVLGGVDIKASGGYVGAPPSRVWVDFLKGGPVLLPYRRRRGCPCSVPWAPDWLIQWVQQTPGTGNGSGGEGSGEPVPGLADLIRTGIPRGQRNAVLHQLACSRYRKLGSGSAQVLGELHEVWQACDPDGFSWGEVEKLAASAQRFVAGLETAEHKAWQDFRSAWANGGRS